MFKRPELPGRNKKNIIPARYPKWGIGFFALTACLSLFDGTRLPDVSVFKHAKSAVMDRNELVVMSANVHGWKGKEGNNFESLSQAIGEERPDLVCLQEVLGDGDELSNLYEDGFNVLFAASSRHTSGRLGNAVLSRAPLSLVEVIDLPNPETSYKRKAIMFSIDTREGNIDFVNMHLSVKAGESEQQARVVVEQAGKKLQGMCADMNQTPDQVQAGAFGHMVASGIHRTEAPTFPADKPTREIDYVMTSCGNTLVAKEHAVPIDSDHLARVETIDITNC